MRQHTYTRRGLVAALLALTGLAAVTAPGQTTDPSKVERTLVDRDNNHTIRVAPGNTLVARLNATPSTGYSWQITKNDPKLLTPQGKPTYLPPPNAAPGAGGRQVFTFKVLSAGKGTLELAYTRPWEKKVKPAKTWRITVLSIGPAD